MVTITPEERSAMRDAFRRLLSESCTQASVRATMATAPGYDAELWRQMAEMGIPGLIIDESYGGIGAGPLELELLMEEAGAALLPSPLFSSGVLAAALLSASTDEAAKVRLLPQIATGELIATVALASERGKWTPEDVGVTAARAGDSWRLNGVCAYVTNAAEAGIFLVVAKTETGVATFEVAPNAAGVARTPMESFDRTQRFSRLEFHDVTAPPIAGAGAQAVETMLDVARVALAGEQAGGARHVFDFTVEYIKMRVQFGRPVGGFQAIKHMAADLLLEVESATSAARHAAQALAEASPETSALVSLAGFACADAYAQIAATAIQMHGGIGFTWEHPCHLYLRRARADAQLLGSSSFYRERYVAALEQAA
jgi:alkylation response protein AidB-like acyl-CoA dehydrogenase